MKNKLLAVILLCFICDIESPPVAPKATEGKSTRVEDNINPEDIEYMNYLKQVVLALEEDKDFAKKVQNVSKEDVESGRVASELQFVSHRIRTKLDELKRIELERLRAMIKMQREAANPQGNNGQLSPPPGDGREWRSISMGDENKRQRLKLPSHLDYKNPHTFEVEDLQKLITAVSSDINDLNEKRKEEFKRYEMEKEHVYREGLKHMTEEERKIAEAKHQEMIDKHRDHPDVHHPGSKQQLEQVWEDVDNLPKEEFEPKTFFRMHDVNGDDHWDEQEVKALVALEVRKMYNISNEEDDPIEMHEEFSRMEDHIFNEADTDKNQLISLDEFIAMTKKADFEQDPGWKGIDEQEIYTPEELEAYEKKLAEQAASQAGSQGEQQYAYHPVEGAVPDNQGVQFQPLPQGPEGQQQVNPVPVQISQGDASHPGQNLEQPAPPAGVQPGQNLEQAAPPAGVQPGQPVDQPPNPPQQPLGNEGAQVV